MKDSRENDVQHLTASQLDKLKQIKLISKQQFDLHYNNSSIYHIGKEYFIGYSPTRISNYFFPLKPTDFLGDQIQKIDTMVLGYEQKSQRIAELLKNYMCSRSNYENFSFCRYLITNLDTLVQDSMLTEVDVVSKKNGNNI